jgi:hypothetical protein
MKLPWARRTSHTDEEQAAAERRFQAVRSHLSILLRELEQTLNRIENKRGAAHD